MAALQPPKLTRVTMHVLLENKANLKFGYILHPLSHVCQYMLFVQFKTNL